jgi:hypothetical protein
MKKEELEAKEYSPILAINIESGVVLENHCGGNDCQGSCNHCSGMVPPISRG